VFCHLRAQFQIDNGKFYVSSEGILIWTCNDRKKIWWS
jgi:hypothetical protein